MARNNNTTSIEDLLPGKPLSTAILFLIFNRLELTKKVFESIRKVKPSRLYIAADGPRKAESGEKELVQSVRDFVLDSVDWECEVISLFQDKNLGCKRAVSKAITWFFENEEMGIILEDDCLPDQSFFWFCEELLLKYQADSRVGQISGFNPLTKFNVPESTYIFSKFGPVWGWASWRRSWNEYDVDMKSLADFKKQGLIKMCTDSRKEEEWRMKTFDDVHDGVIDTWDYQWSYAKLIHSRLSIIPCKSSIKNIGFGPEATHTKVEENKVFHQSFNVFPVRHPLALLRNKDFDEKYLNEFIGLNKMKMIKSNIKYKLRSIIKRYFGKENKNWNEIIDSSAIPLQYEEINYKNKIIVDVERKKVEDWLKQGGLGHFVTDYIHKKGLEFFFSFYILNVKDHVILDAAGGKSSYLKAVKRNSRAKEFYLTDHIFEGIKEIEEGVKIVGGDISSIGLGDESIDRIACHHAFEHFQSNKDIEFITEAYRILKENGILVVIPLFISSEYIECWNIDTEKKFDSASTVIIDKTASLPGADDDGHFARIYSMNSLLERILKHAENLGFVCNIVECLIDGESIPKMDKNFGSLLNKPMRALKLIKGVKSG